jgi:hypothetical protein
MGIYASPDLKFTDEFSKHSNQKIDMGKKLHSIQKKQTKSLWLWLRN